MKEAIQILKKVVLILLISTIMVSCKSKDNKVPAQETNEINTTINEVIKLVNMEVPTSFQSAGVKVEYEDIDNGLKAIVKDKKTNQIIAKYSEKTLEEVTEERLKRWNSYLEISYEVKPVTILIHTGLKLSQRQKSSPKIDNIFYFYQTESNIANFELRNPYESIANSTEFPTDKVVFNITGQIFSTSEMNEYSHLTYKDFQSSRFSMSGSEKEDWSASKNYNSQGTFRVIQDN